MRTLTRRSLAALILALACTADAPEVDRNVPASASRATLPSSYTPGVRRACARAADALLRIAGGRVRVRDTLLDAGQPDAHRRACEIRTDSFPSAAGHRFLEGDVTDITLRWDPFRDGGMQAVALRTDSLRCDATPFSGMGGAAAFTGRYTSVQVRCYPLDRSPRFADERRN